MRTNIQRAGWNSDTVARLRQLWGEGHPTAEIGRRLGLSKNAVIGKAHRLDLPNRPSPIRRGARLAHRQSRRDPGCQSWPRSCP